MHKLSLALAVTMNCELKLGLDWSRSSMVAPLVLVLVLVLLPLLLPGSRCTQVQHCRAADLW
jgi:hypothetical protein